MKASEFLCAVMADVNPQNPDTFEKLPIEQKYSILCSEFNKLRKAYEESRIENKRLIESQKQPEVEENESSMDEDSESEDDDKKEEDEQNLKKRRMSSPKASLPKIPKVTNVAQQQHLKATGTTQKPSEPKKTSSPPAIIAYFNDHKQIINGLKADLKNDNFTVFMRKDHVKIQCVTSTDYVSTKSFLENKAVEYYSFTPKEEKPITLLLKNISNTYDDTEVKAAIEEKIVNINIISVKHMFKYNWIVQLKNKDDVKSFKAIRSLLGHGVKIENFKGKRTLQCKRCQRFKHSANNCKMPYRCVKCSLGHEVGVCSIPNKEENIKEYVINNPDGTKTTRRGLPLKCANCSGEHAASYTKCPARPKVEEPTNNNPNPRSVIQPRSVAQSMRKPEVSYSKAAQATDNSGNFNLNSELVSIFGKNLVECMTKINNFVPRYKKTNDINVKKGELCQLLFELCLN